jgi:hypothetical protein
MTIETRTAIAVTYSASVKALGAAALCCISLRALALAAHVALCTSKYHSRAVTASRIIALAHTALVNLASLAVAAGRAVHCLCLGSAALAALVHRGFSVKDSSAIPAACAIATAHTARVYCGIARRRRNALIDVNNMHATANTAFIELFVTVYYTIAVQTAFAVPATQATSVYLFAAIGDTVTTGTIILAVAYFAVIKRGFSMRGALTILAGIVVASTYSTLIIHFSSVRDPSAIQARRIITVANSA